MEITTKARFKELGNLINDLNSMILNGQVLEAHDRFYADNVVQQENETTICEGKALNRTREEGWVNGITELRTAEVKSVSIDAERSITMVEWFMDYSHKDMGDVAYHQVAVQRWEGDKIVHERYYNGG